MKYKVKIPHKQRVEGAIIHTEITKLVNFAKLNNDLLFQIMKGEIK